MVPGYESFLDATPEKGVILVEYYWHARPARPRSHAPGDKTSMVFFKRILTMDKCWCGSGRAFGRCHRRTDDWTYVTLNPDQHSYGPVVLLERHWNWSRGAAPLERLMQGAGEAGWLPLDAVGDARAWAVPAEPPAVNEIGQLVMGALEVSRHNLRIETNSEQRLDYLQSRVEHLLDLELGQGETRRAEPQKAFELPRRKRR